MEKKVSEMTFFEKVNHIQTKLKAPKGQYNSFGKYSYRSCEDILEGVKPLLAETGLVLTIDDEIQLVGDRYYIKATATIGDGENTISNSAFAREPVSRKGMNDAQVTGLTSSYARKYSLNGLLCIDDTKDADDDTKDADDDTKDADMNYHFIELPKNSKHSTNFWKWKAALKKAVKQGEVSDPKIRLEDGKTSVIYGLNTNK